MFLIDYKDGSSFGENQGYWDDAPDKGITALHLTLPFTVRKVGTGEVLDPSKVTISGYTRYYFANYAETMLPIGGSPLPANLGQGEFKKQIMCGIDDDNNFVCWVEVDKRGNVKFKRYTLNRFMDEIKPHFDAFRKGV